MRGLATVSRGSIGFDCIIDTPPVGVLLGYGFKFRTYYLSDHSTIPTKITLDNWRHWKPIVQDTVDSGLPVILNLETTGKEWMGGAATGIRLGQVAKYLCENLEYPHGVPVPFSFDTDVTIATASIAYEYGQAAAEQLASAWPIGVYGERYIIQALQQYSALGWHSMSTAWDADGPPAPNAIVHVQQRRANTAEISRIPIAGSMDINVALIDFPAWGLVDVTIPDVLPTPVLKPPLEDNDMSAPTSILISSNQQHTFFRGDDGALWHVWSNPLTGQSYGRESLGGDCASSPSASLINGNILVSVKGTDNQIWFRYWNGSVWSDWTAVPDSAGVS